MKWMLLVCLSVNALWGVETVQSSYTITTEDVFQWDAEALKLFIPSASYGEESRFIAYLANAQNDFDLISKEKTEKNTGTLDPISLYVFKLFHPEMQLSIPDLHLQDAYSNELSNQLARGVQERFAYEKATIKPFAIHERQGDWAGVQPYTGIKFPTFKPFFLTSADEVVALKPPTYKIFWDTQLTALKKVMQQVTPAEKERIFYWAGEKGPGAGDWHTIAYEYMKKKNVPVDKVLNLRAKLYAAIVDSMIAVFYSKYIYLVKRPDMLDKDLKTVIKTPNHPSYPSAHSTTCTVCALVLSEAFPDDREYFMNLAEEAGMSRVYAGVHFPIDHMAGKELGKRVYEKIASRSFQFGK